MTFPSEPRSPYCSWSPLLYPFQSPFFIRSYNMPNPSYSVCCYISTIVSNICGYSILLCDELNFKEGNLSVCTFYFPWPIPW
jgi:hypothetical protein